MRTLSSSSSSSNLSLLPLTTTKLTPSVEAPLVLAPEEIGLDAAVGLAVDQQKFFYVTSIYVEHTRG